LYLLGVFGPRAGAAYTASKFAIVGLTRNVGFMYAPKGIRCNAICSGVVNTDFCWYENLSMFGLSRVRLGVAANPCQGSAEEVAKVAFFLHPMTRALLTASR